MELQSRARNVAKIAQVRKKLSSQAKQQNIQQAAAVQ